MQKSVSQLSTQYKQKNSQNCLQEMQNRLQNFQQSLLQVNNKLIHTNDKQDQFSEGQDSEFQNCNSSKRSNYKYKKNINKNQNSQNEKINENQVAKDQNKQLQPNNFTEFVSKTGEKQNQNVNSQTISPSTNTRNVGVLPDINQQHHHNQYQKADNYYLLKGKKKQKNKYQNDLYETSLSETVSSKSSQNFQSSSHEHLNPNHQNKSIQINKKVQDLKTEEDSQDGISLNEQRKRILQGVQELKKLRERRFTFKKLRKIDKLKQRISVLQELEKQIPLIQNIQKQKEIENKLNMNGGDGDISDMSFISQDECQSRNSDDFIFEKLDQISVTEMSEDNEKDRVNEIDEVVVQPKQINKNYQDVLPSINNSTKSTKLTNTLESIMEEHQDYFNHIAGKCACGQCECGRCHVKCLVNQKKPQVYNMKWESSYNRSYNHNQNNIFKDQYDIKMMRKSYQPQQSIPFEYTSTFKRDYQNPPDINFQRVVKYDRIKESPLYSLSTYKSNYVDWKIGVKEEPVQLQPAEMKTVVQGVPLIGSSTMKKDYQAIDHVKTNTAKPPDQSPLPRFSIHRSNFKKHNGFNPLNQMEPKSTESDIFKQKKHEFISIPSFEGQYQTSQSVHQDLGKQHCEGTQKLYAMYQRKIEKYQKRLQEQIEKLEQAK
ncbi:STOP protein (macronuclear) [Tetrahymena thermophila SB210]|uniref:STOP protein n=1 Tax=Tetrahymena thermophila (strain SB210) TaxID=312017 RepID=I7LV33_TETTS|nr:STOP protein [Tetrahymena thermophila SB210]EAR97116.3 STOP protein [Tetrahymena thermophila SB210]|eukprot:XP_001017361.3 STOP protein [Tetrahymena thermophila SB210]